MRRLSFSHFITTIIFSLLLAPIPSHGQQKVRLGLSSITATNGSVWVAEEKTLFTKHGVDVEVIAIGGGGARVVSSLIAGEIHFSVAGGEALYAR